MDYKLIINSLERADLKDGIHLGIIRKGLGAIEHYLSARRLMTRNIYYHGKKNAAEYFMQMFLQTLMDDFVNEEKYIKNNFKEFSGSNLGVFLIALNNYKEELKNIKDENTIIKKKNTFINKNFDTYSKLTDDDVWMAVKKLYYINNGKDSAILGRNLIERILPKYYALSPSKIQTSKNIISNFKNKSKKIRFWQIHVDDLNFVSYEQEKEPIYMVDGKNKKNYSDIFYESEFLKSLSGKKEHNYFLYIDKKIQVEALLQELNSYGCLIYPYFKK